MGKLIVLPGGATFKKEQSEEDMVKEQLANFKSRVGAPANYNYQSATCPPDPDTLQITELNTKKCSVAPNSEPGFISLIIREKFSKNMKPSASFFLMFI